MKEVEPIIADVPLLPVEAPLTVPKTWNTMIPIDALEEYSHLETESVVGQASADREKRLENRRKASKKKWKSCPGRSYKTCTTCNKVREALFLSS